MELYCHAAGLVIEVDGPIHDDHQSYDEERDTILASRGVRVMRFSNDEIREEITSVLARILEATRATVLPFPRREGAGG